LSILKIDSSVLAKAQNIRALFFDIDGVLTDGSITYSEDKEELKTFNVKDGQIIKHLKADGIILGAITGRSSKAVERRCKELKLDFFEQGVSDKWALVQKKAIEYALNPSQIAYIGDDIIDLKTITEVGLGVAPADALAYVKEKADFVSLKNGGKGVLREVGDLILDAQGKLEGMIKEFLN